jgi:hypothetical protein
MKCLVVILVAFCLSGMLASAQELVPLNTENTGEVTTNGGTQDKYWIYDSNSASDSDNNYGETPGSTVGAVLVTRPADQWYVPTSGSWVGPSANQSNSGSNQGGNSYGLYNYELKFSATSAQTSVDISGMFAADNETEIVFNGTVIQSFGSQQYGSLTSFNFDETALVGTNANLLQFIVKNDGTTDSPTGLYVTDFEVVALPEPPTWAIVLAGFGLMSLGRFFLRRRQAGLTEMKLASRIS